jgi:quercetin dioxygenase-like cupin family protein
VKPATFEAALRRRLLERVHASQLHESQFVTLRRDAASFVTIAPGVQQRVLARTEVAVSSLVRMSAGALLPADICTARIELVVLDGEARLGELKLVRGDAASAPNHARHALRAGANGARLYLRCSVGAKSADADGLTHFSTLDDAGWDDFVMGVRIRELSSEGERRSVLVRMRAGASVGAHGHALEEECMMLAGEAFVGDTLLRSGEYQLAPQGSRHGEVATDVGALFFVNGSLDPAAYA